MWRAVLCGQPRRGSSAAEMQVELGMRGQEERATGFVAGRDELLLAPAEDELLGSRLDFASGRFFDCLHLPRTIGARARKAIGPARPRSRCSAALAETVCARKVRRRGSVGTSAKGAEIPDSGPGTYGGSRAKLGSGHRLEHDERFLPEGARRPRKRCSVCPHAIAPAYVWWIEETDVSFVLQRMLATGPPG